MEATKVKISIILLLLKSNKITEVNKHKQENLRPFIGIECLDKFPKKAGALLSLAKPYNIRLLENTPLFVDDAADVITTI